MTIAEVIPEISIGKKLDYLVPLELQHKVAVGCWVTIPVRGRLVGGYVTQLKEHSSFHNIKAIHEVISQGPILTQDLFELALWLSSYYHTPIERTLRTMLPTGVRKGTALKTQYLVVRAKSKEVLLDTCRTLVRSCPQQAMALECMLKVKKGMFLTELLEKARCSREVIKALVDKGLLALERVRSDQSLLHDEEYFFTPPKQLRVEQQKALDSILASLQATCFSTKLLFGITGSGKTEIYMQSIQEALRLNKTVLMLVPEISLTSQTIQQFKSRFSVPITVLHHRLADGERQQAWEDLRRGKSPIVIGARSAIFSPLSNLGLIIVDEEHEGSYKQTDDSPTYHARDVAVMRGKLTNATVILGSATPSLESMQNALLGKYELLQLQERSASAQLPLVHLVDMTREYEKAQCRTPFSQLLLRKIEERYHLGEQSMLFLNRRGYYTTCLCTACSKTIQCDHCDTTLTFHKKTGRLVCHICGSEKTPPKTCPHCKSESMMQFKGLGTEKVEAVLHALFPDIRVMRVDADTTKHKGSLEKILHAFRSGKADVLIGTQMIAKGLHFPDVTLVGVLSCDGAMQIPDFRAQEMAFQLIVQVAGRAGRGIQKGEVILQTTLPSHPIMKAAAAQDFASFQKEELAIRKLFDFPPYTRMVKLITLSEEQQLAIDSMHSWLKEIQKHLPANYVCHPPAEAGHFKVKDVYRYQALVRGPNSRAITQALELAEIALSCPRGVQRLVDVDPLSTFF